MFRATHANDAGAVLVTMGPPQPMSHDAEAAQLAFRSAGITPLLGITSLRHQGLRYDALVEVEPEGTPLTNGSVANPRGIARTLATIVADAHAAGHVLGGIRPELVYSDGQRCTAIAPRAEPFLARSTTREYGVPPCFVEIYLSPEALSLSPVTAASDVFSLCATLVYLFDGAPPFPGDTVLQRMGAALRGEVRPVAVELMVRAGLAVDPRERPEAHSIVAALARL
jgi:hypothetical protein